jgi:hypothetical protein
MEHQVFL